MRGNVTRTTAFLLFLLVMVAPAAAAHQQLRSSAPADGETLTAVPREIRLDFTQAVPLGLAQLRLIGPAGEVALGEYVAEVAAAGVLLAPVDGPLAAGEYRVEWVVTGDDGHAVRGAFAFHLPASASGIAAAVTAGDTLPAAAAAPPGGAQAPTAGGREPGAGEEAAFGPGSPLYWAVRWFALVGVVAVTGAAAAGLLLIPGFRRRAGPTGEPVARLAEHRVAVAGLMASVALAAAMALRLYAQALTLVGSDTSAFEVAPYLLRETAWGLGWHIQGAGLAAAGVGFVVALRARAGWVLAAAGAAVIGVSAALSGHAAALSTAAVAGHALHVVAAGGWLGALFILVVAALPAAFRADPLGRNHPTRMLAAFSPLALLFAALLAGSGLFMASIHLPDLQSLWTSDYGRVLSVKLALLLGVLAAGAYNWRRARPRLQAHGDRGGLRRAVAVELLFAAAVLATTAALTATPPPTESGGLPSASGVGVAAQEAGG